MSTSAAMTGLMGTRHKLCICFTCITDAAHAKKEEWDFKNVAPRWEEKLG
ncbi:hypothetical protein WN943_013385 [Citrus x changshan-huyou]